MRGFDEEEFGARMGSEPDSESIRKRFGERNGPISMRWLAFLLLPQQDFSGRELEVLDSGTAYLADPNAGGRRLPQRDIKRVA